MAASSQTDDLVSVKELASKLKVSDALIKKFIKDFSLETQKIKNRTHLDEGGVETIKTIIKLKAGGKTLKEIKEMFFAAKESVLKEIEEEKKAKRAAEKSKKEPAKKADKKEEKAEKKTDKKSKSKKAKEEKAEDEEFEAEEQELELQEQEAEELEEAPKAKDKKSDKRSKDKNHKAKKDSRKEKSKKQEPEEDDGSLDLNDYIKDELETETISSVADVLSDEELEDFDEDELEKIADIDDLDEFGDLDEIEDADLPVERQISRKRFNFRYVQRQIAHDTKKINYLKYRLRKPNIGLLEKTTFEESLKRRMQLLNGWMHILRWVKSQSRTKSK